MINNTVDIVEFNISKGLGKYVELRDLLNYTIISFAMSEKVRIGTILNRLVGLALFFQPNNFPKKSQSKLY